MVHNDTLCLVSAEQLAPIQALYDQGLYLQAYRRGEEIAPLGLWTGTAARLLAGRLAGNLGGGRLASWHFLRAWRADPLHPEACWFYANYLAGARGPWKAWQFMQRCGDFPNAPVESRSHWYALTADVLARFRDFAAAEEWLARAEALGVNHPWTCLSRATLYSSADQHDKALAAARQALVLRPNYRPALQWLAHFLVQQEEDAEAEAILVDAAKKLESCAVVAQLAGLQFEQRRYQEAGASLAETERLAPLKDKDMTEWLAARRADVAYYLGNRDEALTFARQVKGGFFQKLVTHLENPPEDRRVNLDVPYVRQHFETCGPATLTAICRYWSMPGDHLEMANAITYAGTTNHSERQWATDHGWQTREFTVTWDSAVALLDRGVPFTLTTPEPNGSHLQAVIGYDNVRRSLFLRDPNERHQVEMLGDGLTERYKATGPRGMALVPNAESHRLDGLQLPDAELFDLSHQMHRALDDHHRDKAGKLCRKLEKQAPFHRVALWARRTLAVYDVDVPQELTALDSLLALFPDDLCLQLYRVSCLRELARRDDFLAQLKKLCEQKNTHPTCWQQYAQDLADDAREFKAAEHWINRTMRADPRDARCYHCLARLNWSRQQQLDALLLSRFAACLEEKDEFFSRQYFLNARAVGHTEEALRFLRERFARFGSKSGLPARTLSWAYFELDRSTEGFAVLDEALALRPDDGDLIMAAVESWRSNGEFDKAEELLQRARGRTRPPDWLRSAARLRNAASDLVGAREHWAEVLRVQPLATDAHAAYARLLAETDSRDAALRHIESACARYPHNFSLHRLWLDWLYEDGAAATEPVVRKLIDIHPADGWARRELALTLANQQKLDEALAELDVAARVDPDSVSLFTVKAYVLTALGRLDEAKECYRQAVRLSADSDLAIGEWCSLCDTQAERRAALAFVEEEMKRQVLSGDGILAYRDAGLWTLSREELLESLQRALDARPDLWQAWAAVIRQLREMDRLDEALQLARQAVERFPLLPVLWVDLADIEQERGDEKATEAALLQALRINPDWNVPLRRLADLFERQGRAARAAALLRKAIKRSPLVPEHHFTFAVNLWNTGKAKQALERVQHTLQLDPGYGGAWEAFLDWTWSLQQQSRALDYARTLTTQRPGEARSWLRLAEVLRRQITDAEEPEADQYEECLAAYDRAIALNPRLSEAYDQKAYLLSEQGRYPEAEAACQAAIWNGRPPLILRGRLAWVIAQRGNLGKAIKVMRTTVDEDPAYSWGWRFLADWYEQTGRTKKHLEASEKLVELEPDQALSWVHRGDALRRLGLTEAAIPDFQRALERSPDYLYPALVLFDLALADDDLKAARRVLKTIKRLADPEDYLRRALELSVAAEEPEKAGKFLERLCALGDNLTDALEDAVEQFEEVGWAERCEKIIWQQLERGDGVAKEWAQLALRRRSASKVVQQIEKVPNKDRRKGIALLAVTERFAEEGQHARMSTLLRRHATLLGSELRWWGVVGHHYSYINDDRRVVEWMKDWRERPGVQSWMLLNLSLAQHGLGLWEEALEVHRFAVEQREPDYTQQYHEAWLALDAALTDDLDAVRDFFDRYTVDDLDANHAWIANLARAVLLAATGRDKVKALSRAKKHLTDAAQRSDPIDRDACFEIAYRRTVKHLVRLCGQEWGKPRTIMPRRAKSAHP